MSRPFWQADDVDSCYARCVDVVMGWRILVHFRIRAHEAGMPSWLVHVHLALVGSLGISAPILPR